MDAPPAKKAKEDDNSEPTVIRLRVENPGKVEYVDSPEVIIRGFPVCLRVQRVVHITSTVSWLVTAVTSIDTIANNYYCDYKLAVKLINHADESRTIESSTTGRFDTSESGSEHAVTFVATTNFCDPAQGFLKDGALHFVAVITVTNSSFRKRNAIDFLSPSDLFDVTFVIDGKKVYASRKFLASQSDVFMGMFFNGFRESAEAVEITIPDVRLEDMLNVLNFLYQTGNGVKASNFEGLLAVADKYNITLIIDAVERYLLLDKQNLAPLSRKLRLSDDHRLTHLLEQLLSSIDECSTIEELRKSSDYGYLPDLRKEYLFGKYVELAHEERERLKDEEREARYAAREANASLAWEMARHRNAS